LKKKEKKKKKEKEKEMSSESFSLVQVTTALINGVKMYCPGKGSLDLFHDNNEHTLSTHKVSPPFTEEEKRTRGFSWHRSLAEAIIYPRFPEKSPNWIIFIDKEDGATIVAQQVWGGRFKFPRRYYKLHGKALVERGDICIKTQYSFHVAPSSLFSFFPLRNYKRIISSTRPLVSLEIFTDMEAKHWEWGRRREEGENPGPIC
jgi:hypothetical protein